ncbi:Uncharacterized protein FWK35_00035973, partial [Aphis craccivora]
VSCDAHRRRFEPRSRAAPLFGQVTVSGEEKPPSPTPGMAETYGCPIEILPIRRPN